MVLSEVNLIHNDRPGANFIKLFSLKFMNSPNKIVCLSMVDLSWPRLIFLVNNQEPTQVSKGSQTLKLIWIINKFWKKQFYNIGP